MLVAAVVITPIGGWQAAAALIVGLVVLTQVPQLVEIIGVGLVVAGVAIQREPAHGL